VITNLENIFYSIDRSIDDKRKNVVITNHENIFIV